jgi:hypothetical protein
MFIFATTESTRLMLTLSNKFGQRGLWKCRSYGKRKERVSHTTLENPSGFPHSLQAPTAIY